VRVTVHDATVGARVLDVLAAHDVPADQGLQARDVLVFLTGLVAEARMVAVMRQVDALAGVNGAVRLRVEALEP
jgi:hypothetical protein